MKNGEHREKTMLINYNQKIWQDIKTIESSLVKEKDITQIKSSKKKPSSFWWIQSSQQSTVTAFRDFVNGILLACREDSNVTVVMDSPLTEHTIAQLDLELARLKAIEVRIIGVFDAPFDLSWFFLVEQADKCLFQHREKAEVKELSKSETVSVTVGEMLLDSLNYYNVFCYESIKGIDHE